MKKIIRLHMLYGCFLSMIVACTNPINFGLDLYELANFQQDGSGKFATVLRLDKACKLLDLGEYIAQDHIKLVRILINEAFLVASKNLGNVPGISQVKLTQGTNRLNFKLTFQFKDLQALNKAMNILYLPADPPQFVYFEVKNHIFIRNDSKNFTRLVDFYKKVDDSLVRSFDIDFFLKNTRLLVKYSFTRPIKAISNPLASIASNGQSVTIVHYPLHKKEKSLSISNKIAFQ